MNTLDKFNLKIIALQETHFQGENNFDSENYRSILDSVQHQTIGI